MPLVSRLFGGLDFSSYYLPLAGQAMGLSLVEAKKLGAVFAYGSFLTVALNFTILALVIFVAVRQMNRLLKNSEPAPAPAPVVPEDVQLLREIRDALTQR
jgi:large conductance mechanosensitive channel